jgi:hypothetical protein
VLSKPGHYLGGWHDPDSGKVFLDIAIVIKTAKEARKLVMEHDQIGYFDLASKKTIIVNRAATSGGVA